MPFRKHFVLPIFLHLLLWYKPWTCLSAPIDGNATISFANSTLYLSNEINEPMYKSKSDIAFDVDLMNDNPELSEADGKNEAGNSKGKPLSTSMCTQ